jgi:hypothetical protein
LRAEVDRIRKCDTREWILRAPEICSNVYKQEIDTKDERQQTWRRTKGNDKKWIRAERSGINKRKKMRDRKRQEWKNQEKI